MGRRANGEGSVFRRSDGRYGAAAFVHTTNGTRRRIQVYGATRAEASEKLAALLANDHAGVTVPTRSVKVSAYLDYWLEHIVLPTCRQSTYSSYEYVVRLYLKPTLGSQPLRRLGVSTVQQAFNAKLADGASTRMIAEMRKVLGAALTQAQREELIMRNAARLVRPPPYRAKEVYPWTAEQVNRFLEVARSNRLYPLYVLLILYGLRRGEVLGLRWQDIDLDRQVIHIRQQLQANVKGLQQLPVKTAAAERDLPLLGLPARLLAEQRTTAGSAGDLVFTSIKGTPINPHNLGRSFQALRESVGLPRITLHHLRHTTATLLKGLNVSVRDTQTILGHASPTTTQQIYQHSNGADQRVALQGIEQLLLTADKSGARCCQPLLSNNTFVPQLTIDNTGGPGGTRTLDILLKSFPQLPWYASTTSVKQLVTAWQQCLLLGHAAVTTAVKIVTDSPQVDSTNHSGRDTKYTSEYN
jgi:integrase